MHALVDYWRKILFIIPVLLLASCYTPPQEYKGNDTLELAKPKKEVWDKTVQYFAINKISIKTIDENSGIIIGERPADPKSADCGMANRTPVLEKEEDEDVERPMMEFNVYIKTQNNKTVVTVHNRAGKTKAFQPMKGDVDTICESKGTVEKGILDYLKK